MYLCKDSNLFFSKACFYHPTICFHLVILHDTVKSFYRSIFWQFGLYHSGHFAFNFMAVRNRGRNLIGAIYLSCQYINLKEGPFDAKFYIFDQIFF